MIHAPAAERVFSALEEVHDPHVPVSLRRMGMIAAVDVAPDGHVLVRTRMPCIACPGSAIIREEIQAAVGKLDGVTQVDVAIAWEKPWHRDLVDEEVRELMRVNGIQI